MPSDIHNLVAIRDVSLKKHKLRIHHLIHTVQGSLAFIAKLGKGYWSKTTITVWRKSNVIKITVTATTGKECSK
jgi:hypothetical protein